MKAILVIEMPESCAKCPVVATSGCKESKKVNDKKLYEGRLFNYSLQPINLETE